MSERSIWRQRVSDGCLLFIGDNILIYIGQMSFTPRMRGYYKVRGFLFVGGE